jgi:cytochrome c oxidase cbb3-type subunit 3
LLWSQSIRRRAEQGDTTGHVWDETLEEYNNPLPRWWMWLFYITVVFSLVYPCSIRRSGASRAYSAGLRRAAQRKWRKVDAAVKPLFDKY